MIITNTTNNLLLRGDGYKYSHTFLYPKNTTYMMSYIESRGGVYDEVLFFGLQYYIKEYLTTPITMKDVEVAQKFITRYGAPFDYEGWKYIVETYKGYIPVKIRAVPEGTLIQNNKLDALMDEFCMNFVIYKNIKRNFKFTFNSFLKDQVITFKYSVKLQ
jgi:nicotinic acid phosphoribosyltransferase